jgi:hypothetical protein
MKRVFVLSVLLAATVPALAIDFPNGLSMDGIGNVTIGMDIDRVELLLHDKFGYNQFANHGCSTVTTPTLETTGLSFMIESKKLTRVNVDFYAKSPLPMTIKTDTGIGLGSSEEDVLKAYPSAKVNPNPADPTWHTIIDEAPDRTKGIVFETNGKTVKSMRAGATPAINYGNGCNE